jgi:N-acetyl-1-D-myo-inositol-2-amino-2-deoxy-alpha-D-glucopyranoside deacetylase
VRLPPARDLAVGLPAALIVGAAVGLLGAFKHQVGISAATGAGFPLGLILSLAMVAVVLAAFRVAFDTRLYAVAAAAGIIVMVVILSGTGPGGSTVTIANYAGFLWSVAPAVLAAVVIGTPRIRRLRGGPARDGILAAPPEGDAS